MRQQDIRVMCWQGSLSSVVYYLAFSLSCFLWCCSSSKIFNRESTWMCRESNSSMLRRRPLWLQVQLRLPKSSKRGNLHGVWAAIWDSSRPSCRKRRGTWCWSRSTTTDKPKKASTPTPSASTPSKVSPCIKSKLRSISSVPRFKVNHLTFTQQSKNS